MGRLSNERANRIYYEAKQLKASMTEEDKAKRKEAQRYAPSEPSNKSAKTTSSASTSSPKANAKYVPMDTADNQYAQALAAFNPGGTFVPRAAQEEIAARKAANRSRYMDALDTSTRAGVAAAGSGTVRPVMNTDETVAVRNEWAKKAAQYEADRQSAGREFRSARGTDEYRDRVGRFDSSAIPYGANNTGRIRYALDDSFRNELDTFNQRQGLRDSTYENLKYLNEFEKNDLANLVAQGDYDRANEYLDHLQPELNARMQGNVSAANKKLAEEQPVAGVLANIVGTREAGMALLPTIQGAINEEMGVYKPVDTNGSAFRAAHLLRDTEEGIGNAAYNAAGGGTKGEIARTLAQAGLSAAQNASMLPMGGTAPLVFMGSMAAGQSALDTLESGGTAQDALKVAVATGIIETATEKIGIENFFRISRLGKKGIQQLLKDYKLGKPLVNNIKSFAGDLGTQMAAEGAEEMIAEVAENLADTAIRGDNGQYAQLVQTYMANGMSEEQAKARAFTDMYIDNVLKAGAQGALAGGMLGVVGATIGTRYNNEVTAVGAQLAELNITPQQLITAVQQSGSKDAQDFARELSRKLVLGQEVTLADMGQLHLLSNNYITSKDYEAVQKAAIAEEEAARNAGGNVRESEAAAGVQQGETRENETVKPENETVKPENETKRETGTIDVASKATNNTESIESTAGQATGGTLTVSPTAMASKLTEAERTEIERIGATPAIVKEDGKRVRVAWRGDNGTVAQKWFSQDEISYGETASVRGEKTAPVAVSGETAAAAPTVFAQGAQVQTPQGEGTVVMAADNTVAVRLANGTTEIFKTSDLSSAQANANENTALPQSANAQTATGNTAANAETNEANAEGRGETGTQSKTVAETSWENIQKIVQTKAKGGLSQKDEYTMNSAGRRAFDRIGRALGVEIHFVDRIVNEEGESNGLYQNGHIFIARDAENPYHVVLAHEITHHFEKTAPDVYEKFKGAALKMNPGLVEKYMARWGYDEATAEFEVAADFAGELLEKEGTVKRVIKEDISAARGFHRAMNAVFDKVRGDDTKGLTEEEKKLDAQLDAARDMWRRCLRETRGEKAEGGESKGQFSRKLTPEQRKLDEDYMAAVERGDMETAQRMVDEAAKAAGYTVKAYHGTPSTNTEKNQKYISSVLKLYALTHPNEPQLSEPGDYGTDSYKKFWAFANLTSNARWLNRLSKAYNVPENLKHVIKLGPTRNFTSFNVNSFGHHSQAANETEIGAYFTTDEEAAYAFTSTYEYDPLLKTERKTSYGKGYIYNVYLKPDNAIKRKAQIGRRNFEEIVVKDARDIKSADPVTYDDDGNVIPLSERFNEKKDDIRFSRKLTSEQRKLDADYLAAVERGDMETAQRMVDEAAKQAMPGTKAVDKNGKLLRAYHGTKEQFTAFLRDEIGSLGRFEGSGFNFTPSEGRAKNYGGNVLSVYLDISKPLNAQKKTITVPQLAQIIRQADPTGDNIIANYASSVNDYGTERFVARESLLVARSIWDFCENDVDIYSALSVANIDAEGLIETFEKLGYDGAIHYDGYGEIKTLIAFSSNQIKSADPVTYDDDGNVIPLSERFNEKKDDIRFSRKVSPEITKADVEVLRGIGRKSVNDFTSSDIRKTEPWARKFYKELGVKSPFFRAWFGDWRANDAADVTVVEASALSKVAADKEKNADTGKLISWGHQLFGETKVHQRRDGIASSIAGNIREIVRNAVLLDTVISIPDSDSKMPNTAFMHHFYSVASYNGKLHLLKLYAEEALNNKETEVFTRAYELKDIKEIASFVDSVLPNNGGLTDAKNAIPKYKVADLFALVKKYDPDFKPKPASKVVNEDGTPKVVYHGTKSKFTVFNRGEKNGWLGKSIYFAESKEYAKENGKRVVAAYLRATNPFMVKGDSPSNVLSEIRRKFPEADDYNMTEILSANGYDAIIFNHWDKGEIIGVFSPEQIKSATDNVGTFDRSNPDIRYSRKGQDAAMRRANRLARENARLKGQFKLTKGVKLRESDIRKVTRDLLKDYEIIDFDKEQLERYIKMMAEAAAQADESNADATWESIRNVAHGLSREVGRAAFARYADVDEEYDADLVRETYEDIRRHLGRQRVLNPWFKDPWVENESPQRKEMRDYYRRKLFGVLTLTSDRSVDKGPLGDIGKLYEELTETFGEAYFPSDVTNDEDQIMHIADVLDDLKDTLTMIGERTPMTVAEDVEQSSRDETRRAAYEDEVYGELYARLEEDILNRIAEVRREKPTFADKKKAEQYAAVERAIEQTQSKAEAAEIANRIEDARKYRERIAKLEERLNKLKEENKGLKDKARQTQKDIREADTYYRQAAREERKEERKRQKEAEEAARRARRDAVNEALRQARESRAKAINELKDKYKAKTAEARERQQKKELERRIRKTANRLSQALLKPDNTKHVPKQLRAFVSEVLSNINLSKGKKANWGALKAEYERIYNESIGDESLVPEDPDLLLNLEAIASASDTPISKMNSEQLAVIWDVLKAANGLVNIVKREFSSGKAQERKRKANMIRSFVEQFDPYEEFNTRNRLAMALDRTGKLLTIDNLLPEKYFHRFGEAGDELFKSLTDGQNTYISILDESRGEVVKALRPFKGDARKLIENWKDDVQTFRVGDNEITLSKAQVMTLYAYMKRPQARGHVLGGGIVGQTVAKKSALKALTQNTPVAVSEQDVEKITATLSGEETRLIDTLVKYLSGKLGEHGNEATVKTYGYVKFTEPYYVPIKVLKSTVKQGNDTSLLAQEITKRTGIPNAGFSKPTIDGAKNAVVLEPFFDLFSEHVVGMAKYAGFLEPLVEMNRLRNYQFHTQKRGTKHFPEAEAAPRLNEAAKKNTPALGTSSSTEYERALDRISGGAIVPAAGAEVSEDVAGARREVVPAEPNYGEPSSSERRKLTFETNMESVIKALLGTAGLNYWDNLVSDINGGEITRNNESYFDAFVGGYKAAAVSANLRVIIQQPTAIIRALAHISPRHMIAALSKLPVPREWARITQEVPIALWKDWGHFDLNTGRKLQDVILGTDSKFEKARQFGMKGMGWADSWAWTILFHAVEHEAEEQGFTPGTEEFKTVVKDRFTDIINKTQVVDGVLQRTQLMRNQNPVTKMATSFMAEPMRTLNMVTGAWWDLRHARGAEAKRAARKALTRVLVSVVASNTINALMQSLWDGWRDDDRDKKYWERVWAAFIGIRGDEETAGDKVKAFLGGNFANGLNPLTFIPFIKDVVSLLQGYSVKRMDVESISRFTQKLQSTMKAINGEGKTSAFANALDLVGELGRACGLPAATVKRDFIGVINTIAVENNNYALMYWLDSWQYPLDKNKARYVDIMLKAHDAGDTETENRILDDLRAAGVDDKTIMSTANNIRKKQEDVGSVKDLETRYRTPEEQKKYDAEQKAYADLERYAKGTTAYKQADSKERTAYEKMLKDALNNNKTAQERHEKAQEIGVSDNQYMEFLIAQDVANRQRNDGTGDNEGKPGGVSKNDYIAALDMTSMTQSQKSAAFAKKYPNSKTGNPYN